MNLPHSLGRYNDRIESINLFCYEREVILSFTSYYTSTTSASPRNLFKMNRFHDNHHNSVTILVTNPVPF